MNDKEIAHVKQNSDCSWADPQSLEKFRDCIVDQIRDFEKGIISEIWSGIFRSCRGVLL